MVVICGHGFEGGGSALGLRCRCLEGFPLMSVYAFDPARREIVAVWPAIVGSLSQVAAAAPAATTEGDAGSLCAALTRLSGALWDMYVRPASAGR